MRLCPTVRLLEELEESSFEDFLNLDNEDDESWERIVEKLESLYPRKWRQP